MNIEKALRIMSERFPILKEAALKAIDDQDALIDFLNTILEQYNETPGNKERMNKQFGEDVMQCFVDKANEINAWADVRLMEIQAKEGLI
jgi:hypothetical protein